MHWYLEVLGKYALFTGRARRSEYWYFVLISTVITVILMLVDALIRKLTGIQIGLLANIYGLAVFLPTLGVSIRRLHDTNRSAWWTLIALVPLVGLILIAFLAQDSAPGTNRYGMNPKNAVA